MTVGVKDSGAEEVVEERDETGPFMVVIESGFEEMFDIWRVCGHDPINFSGSDKYGRVIREGNENVSSPVEEPVAV